MATSMEKEFTPPVYSEKLDQGSVVWRAPSNIALVKYWGKKKHQIPANPSLSFTLNACSTTTKLTFAKREGKRSDFSFEVLLDGRPKADFGPKIHAFLERIDPYMPFLRDYHFIVETSNTFPHSSGIASSASGMAALALCLMDVENTLIKGNTVDFYQKASFLARLGSGSACRSIRGNLVHWGEHAQIEGSSNLFGIPYPLGLHPVFARFHDTILLVDKGKKQISSTVGHGLMHGHPYAQTRFVQAHGHISDLKSILAQGDLEGFIRIVESEALTLHAMMMMSNPYFMLMKPNTLEIIERIWNFRQGSGTHLCFTLDAGANVHVLYPEEEKGIVYPFIAQELAPFCEKGQFISDQVGVGAKKMKAMNE